jgi:hypothetical protein
VFIGLPVVLVAVALHTWSQLRTLPPAPVVAPVPVPPADGATRSSPQNA